MPIGTNVAADKQEVVISIDHKFDYSCAFEFKQSYTDLNPEYTYIINMQSTEYIDSSAIGLLLQLHAHLGSQYGKIRLVNVSDNVRKILEIVKISNLIEVA